MSRMYFFKLSGELMSGEKQKGFLIESADIIADQLALIVRDYNAKIAIVIGGGNIFRGRDKRGIINRITTDYSSDYMGMLSTFINAVGLTDLLKNKYGVRTKIFSSPVYPPITEEFNPNDKDFYFYNYDVIIFAGGIGQPGFTTDTCAVLKAKQLGFDKIFKGTKVDGVYVNDEVSNPESKIHILSYQDAINQNIMVMDMAAFGLAKESKIEIVIFNAFKPNSFADIIENEHRGSIITYKHVF